MPNFQTFFSFSKSVPKKNPPRKVSGDCDTNNKAMKLIILNKADSTGSVLGTMFKIECSAMNRCPTIFKAKTHAFVLRIRATGRVVCYNKFYYHLSDTIPRSKVSYIPAGTY